MRQQQRKNVECSSAPSQASARTHRTVGSTEGRKAAVFFWLFVVAGFLLLSGATIWNLITDLPWEMILDIIGNRDYFIVWALIQQQKGCNSRGFLVGWKRVVEGGNWSTAFLWQQRKVLRAPTEKKGSSSGWGDEENCILRGREIFNLFFVLNVLKTMSGELERILGLWVFRWSCFGKINFADHHYVFQEIINEIVALLKRI